MSTAMPEVSAMALEINRLQQTIRSVLDMYVSTLIEKHGGRVFIKKETMEAVAPQMMGVYAEDMGPVLKTIKITLCDRYNKPCIAMGDNLPEPEPEPTGASGLTIAAPMSEEPPNLPSAACEASWHSDPDALGRRCPVCGSTERGPNLDNATDNQSATDSRSN